MDVGEGDGSGGEEDGLRSEVLRDKSMDVGSMDALKKRIEVRVVIKDPRSTLAATRVEFFRRRTAHELPEITNRRALSDPLSRNTQYVTAGDEKPKPQPNATARGRCPAPWETKMLKRGIK